MKVAWDKVFVFTFSISLIISLLVISFRHQTMSEQQWFICVWALAFGGAGFAAFLPGSIEWQLKPGLKATGAFAVLLLVFWFGRSVRSIQGDIKEWKLESPPVEQDVGPDAMKASVYVLVNGHMVEAEGTPPNWLPVRKNDLDKNIQVQHGVGGIVVTTNPQAAGVKLTFVVQDNDQWWVSDDVVVPPSFNVRLTHARDTEIRNRVQP